MDETEYTVESFRAAVDAGGVVPGDTVRAVSKRGKEYAATFLRLTTAEILIVEPNEKVYGIALSRLETIFVVREARDT